MSALFRLGTSTAFLLLSLPATTHPASGQSADYSQAPYQPPAYAGLYNDPYRRPLDGSYRYSPPADVARWSGLYLGANIGGGFGGTDLDGFGNAELDTSGFEGGLLGGYNFQVGNVVAGFETDISWTAIDGNEISSGTAFSANHDWMSSFRVRLGYAMDKWMIYGTAGLALTSFDLDALGSGSQISSSETLTGYAIGAGAEYALTNNISLKGEALYYDFEENRFPASGSNVTVEPDIFSVRAGITYRFD